MQKSNVFIYVCMYLCIFIHVCECLQYICIGRVSKQQQKQHTNILLTRHCQMITTNLIEFYTEHTDTRTDMHKQAHTCMCTHKQKIKSEWHFNIYDWQMDKRTERQKDERTDRETSRLTERREDRRTGREASSQRDRQTKRQIEKQIDRQRDRQPIKKTDRQTDSGAACKPRPHSTTLHLLTIHAHSFRCRLSRCSKMR